MTTTELVFTLGTRPEIIKLAPVIREVENRDNLSAYVIHTGQHYDSELTDVFFENLGLSSPDEYLDVGSGSQGEQTADTITGVEEIVLDREPEIVGALGDTNAVLGTAIAVSKTPASFAHIEAGIRSYDRTMPEEVNRVLADQIGDLNFAPTQTSLQNLENEGIPDDVYLVGNTIVDACVEHSEIAEKQSNILEKMDVSEEKYAVATIHRPRNTDNIDRLEEIIQGLANQTFPVIFPVHPRTEAVLENTNVKDKRNLHIVDPLDYIDFLKLLKNSRLVVTDSGGIQEEASILEIPCLTVRPNTERPETIDAGVNELITPSQVGLHMSEIYNDREARNRMKGASDLYGDGEASSKIVDIISSKFASN